MFGSLIEISRGRFKGVVGCIDAVYIKDGCFNFDLEVLSNPGNFLHAELKNYFAENVVRDIITSKRTNIRSTNGS